MGHSIAWNTLEYRLHARVGILHGTKPAVCLWYALRALDVDGTGKVTPRSLGLL